MKLWPWGKRTIKAPSPPMRLKSLPLPEATPRWWLFAKRAQWRADVAILEGYNASSIVYACVEKRAKLIASVPWVAMQRTGDGYEARPDSPLQRLVNKPNDWQSWYELIYEASQNIDLSGNAYISEIRAGTSNLPFELWLLPSEHMAIKPGREQMIDYYEYDELGIRRRIEPQDMIQLRMPNPGNRWFGMPVLQAAGRATDVDRESGIWQKVSLQNRSVTDVHVQVPAGTDPEEIEEAERRWLERRSGPDNADKPLFTSGDVNLLGRTAKEMDFVESRRAVWTEICAVFGMSLANLGMTESVNLANAQAMDKALWMNTIIPQLELIERQLNNQLSSEFGPEWKLEADLSGIDALQEDFGDKLNNAEKLMRLGYSQREINDKLELGFDSGELSDVRYEPVGLMPAGQADPFGDEPEDTPEQRAALVRLAYG